MRKSRFIAICFLTVLLASVFCVYKVAGSLTPPSIDTTANSHKLQYVEAQGSASLTITTSTTDEVIYATFYSENDGYTLGISSNPALTWHYRGGGEVNGRGEIAAWWAVSNVAQSVQITFTSSVSSKRDYIMSAFCVLNANTASPFDPNLSSASFNSGNGVAASASLTTTDTNDVVVGVLGIINNKAITEGSGYTLIDKVSTAASGATEYKTMTNPGTYTPTFTLVSGGWVEIADAFVGSSMTVLPEYNFGATAFIVSFAALLVFFKRKSLRIQSA
jgi:hypothetical protein